MIKPMVFTYYGKTYYISLATKYCLGTENIVSSSKNITSTAIVAMANGYSTSKITQLITVQS